MCEHDLEGIVAKRLDDPYEPRIKWLKIKKPYVSNLTLRNLSAAYIGQDAEWLSQETQMEYPHNPLGDAVRAYADSKLGQTVGGGECTDLVDEALRVAGAKPGLNYVWGTEIPAPPQWGTWQNGDIIQFWDAQFKWTENGGTYTWGVGPTGRHTAIIWNAEFTNSRPWDAWLIHQNDGVRQVTQRQVYLHDLVSGRFIVYRPVPK
jgi:hypothetical protein